MTPVHRASLGLNRRVILAVIVGLHDPKDERTNIGTKKPYPSTHQLSLILCYFFSLLEAESIASMRASRSAKFCILFCEL